MSGPQNARLFYRKLCTSLADREMADGFFTGGCQILVNFFSFSKSPLSLLGRTSSEILKLYYFRAATCNKSILLIIIHGLLHTYPAPSHHILFETAKSPLFKTRAEGKRTFMMENYFNGSAGVLTLIQQLNLMPQQNSFRCRPILQIS